MAKKTKGRALIREQSFPDVNGHHAWTLTHDEVTRTVMIQYTDELFARGHREIDHMCETVTLQLHNCLRLYDEIKRSGDDA